MFYTSPIEENECGRRKLNDIYEKKNNNQTK